MSDVTGELCDLCQHPLMRRPVRAMEVDALNSILRVLEPLEPAARERCLAAARCVFNESAAHEALASLVERDPSWSRCG